MRNVVVLIAAQFFAAWGQTSLVILGGIAGAALAPDEGLATLPLACAILGVAAAAMPAALGMQRYGRRPVLIGGMLLAVAGAILAALALNAGDFWLFCAGITLIGSNMAFTAQFRFAAVESVAPEWISRVVAWVMLGTVAAAVVAPQLLIAQRHWIGAEYTGSYLLLAVTYLCGAGCLLGLRGLGPAETPVPGESRPLGEILRQPTFLAAVLAAAAGYGVMVLIMTATPLSMHIGEGHPLSHTTMVIQAHVLAMYLPSLVTGSLVARLGARRMILLGSLLEVGCIAVALSGREVGHYGAALVALGVGWNLLFVAGTTLLTRTYRPSERFRVQAVNDFTIFAITAAASLLAGALMAAIGWRGLNLIGLVPLIVLLVILLGSRRTGRAAVFHNPGHSGD